MAANIFTGATNNNWGTATNWSLGTVPTATDGHVATFDATSPNCTVDTSTRVCNILDFTGYTNTITMTFGITVSGNVTLVSTMVSRVAGSGTLTINATATLTSNGGTWNNALTLATTSTTITLADNWTVNGLVYLGTIVLNGNTLNINGSFTQVTSMTSSGTTLLKFIGTGTWTGNFYVMNNVEINTSGTLTLSTQTLFYNATLTYVTGTVVTTGNTLTTNVNTILNTSGMTWNSISTSGTLTITSNLNCVNLTLVGAVSGLYNVYISGNLTHNSNLSIGTSTLIMNGTGTWSSSTGYIQQPNIQLTGNITISGSPWFINGSLSTIGGTVNAGTSTLKTQNTTLNTSNTNWYNFESDGLVTLLSDLNVSNNFTNGAGYASTLNGLFNINVSGSLVGGAGVSTTGTATIRLIGTGTWSGNTIFRNNLIINTAGTITISSNVYYNTGTLTYTAGTVTTTGSILNISASVTLNTAGMTWNNFTPTASGVVITLSSDLNIGGNFTSTNPVTINGFTMYVSGGLATYSSFAGTTICVLNGTGTWIGAGSNNKQMIINTAGTITISGTINVTGSVGGSITYTSGTVVTTGSTLIITDNYTINSNGIYWNDINLNQSATRTLTNNSLLKCVNLIGGTVNGQIVNGSDVEVTGNITITGYILLGTSTIKLTGTGTWSGTGSIRNNLIIDTVGTITVSGTVNYNTGTLTYIAGTVVTTGSTLNIAANTTLNTNGINWNIASFNSGNITQLSNFTCIDLNIGGVSNLYGFNIYVSGNLTNTANMADTASTSVIVLNGTGTWTSTVGNSWRHRISETIIDTLGTIIINNINISSNNLLAKLTYVKGDVQCIGTVGFEGVGILDATRPDGTKIIFNNLNFSSITFLSDVYVKNNIFATQQVNGFSVYCGGTLSINAQMYGTTNFIMNGTGSVLMTNVTNGMANNLYINTNGTITLGALRFWTTCTFALIKGKVLTNNLSTLTLTPSMTLINMHLINFSQVTVTAGVTLTMNEFFCGRPDVKTKVISTSTTSNYNVTFTNTIPKKAFHVNVKNCTVLRNQLNIINRDGNGGRNSGILFGESGMNGTPMNMFPSDSTFSTGNGFNTVY